MKIRVNRIARSIEKSLFQLSYTSKAAGYTVAAKRVGLSLFERVGVRRAVVRRAGQNLDILGAHVQCSIVPGWTALKGLAFSDYLPLPMCDETGHCLILNKQDADRWIEQFSAAAPSAAAQARLRHSDALLTSTRDAISACSVYLQRFSTFDDVDAGISELRKRATKAQLEESTIWSRDRIVVIPNGFKWYEAACLLVAVYHNEAEISPMNFGPTPAYDDDRALMIRLQYLASRLANEAGWNWPIIN